MDREWLWLHVWKIFQRKHLVIFGADIWLASLDKWWTRKIWGRKFSRREEKRASESRQDQAAGARTAGMELLQGGLIYSLEYLNWIEDLTMLCIRVNYFHKAGSRMLVFFWTWNIDFSRVSSLLTSELERTLSHWFIYFLEMSSHSNLWNLWICCKMSEEIRLLIIWPLVRVELSCVTQVMVELSYFIQMGFM